MGPDSPLELEESQLFGEESDVEEAPLDMSCRGGTAFPADTAAAAFSDDASASDDDGIVLESECSSSGAARGGRGGRACSLLTAGPCLSQPPQLPARHLLPPQLPPPPALRARRAPSTDLACSANAVFDRRVFVGAADESEDAEQDLVDRLRSLQSSLEHTSAPLRSEGALPRCALCSAWPDVSACCLPVVARTLLAGTTSQLQLITPACRPLRSCLQKARWARPTPAMWAA